MTDLSKIDFTKCVLPMWQNEQVIAERYTGLVSPVHIMTEADGVLASRSKDGEWELIRPNGLAFSKIDELKAICAKVDVFIEAELKRIAESPWRECTAEEAMAHPEVSECKIHEPPLNSGWFPARWINWLYVDVVKLKKKSTFRTSAPKVEVKIPTVKAPDGYRWKLSQFNGRWLLTPEASGHLYGVPGTRVERDAMAACVMAFDEKNGATQFATCWNGKTWTLT